MKEAELDLKEGADILMVKPGMPYLDVIQIVFKFECSNIRISSEWRICNVAAYMTKKYLNIMNPETLISLFRAGSSSVITYYAKWVAENYDDIS